jgi:deazaflavin-dependent oxidoreductase (nitroreductase family)
VSVDPEPSGDQAPGRAGLAMARLARLLTRPRPLFTAFTRFQAWMLRASRGRIRRSVVFAGGQPVLSLTTTGRRSGRRRSTMVSYMREGDAYVVSGVTLGSERDPAWCLNLMSDPEAEIVVDGKRIAVVARRVEGEERQRLWRRWVERLPATAAFSQISGREIPVMLLEPKRTT